MKRCNIERARMIVTSTKDRKRGTARKTSVDNDRSSKSRNFVCSTSSVRFSLFVASSQDTRVTILARPREVVLRWTIDENRYTRCALDCALQRSTPYRSFINSSYNAISFFQKIFRLSLDHPQILQTIHDLRSFLCGFNKGLTYLGSQAPCSSNRVTLRCVVVFVTNTASCFRSFFKLKIINRTLVQSHVVQVRVFPGFDDRLVLQLKNVFKIMIRRYHDD